MEDIGYADLRESLEEMRRVVVGQDAMVRAIVIAILSEQHVLIEGAPGLAKTLAVKTAAQVFGLSFKRIQFTPDLAPSDITGMRVFDVKSGAFNFALGPVFANLVLADEINRAPAKVQSALLEVMQEKQVTIAGETFKVPSPFSVLATQNPLESEGTFPLPEAQNDRFLMKVVIDYPTYDEEAVIAERALAGLPVPRQVLTPERLQHHIQACKHVQIPPSVIQRAVRLVASTRPSAMLVLPHIKNVIQVGAGPRATISLLLASRASAYLNGRLIVTPQDLYANALNVLQHRIVLTFEAQAKQITCRDVVQDLVGAMMQRDRDMGVL